ncbi:MAG TPA: inositol monophosphatase family protein [Acidimicrobiales bacterium]
MPEQLLALATDVATRAARLLVEAQGRERISVDTKSSRTDMVTEMDRASEQLIARELLTARPEDGIVGEEGSARTGTSGLRWVVDPIDGTTNYLYGFPGWSVSIAVEDDEGVVAGVVVDPSHNDVFGATRGGGARRNGRPIRCSAQTVLAEALLATGFNYQADQRRRQAEILVALLPQVRDIRRMGSASLDLCSVACGRVDAYYERGVSWWDIAAGSLIAAEAGAVVFSLDDGPVTGDSVMASAPGVAAPLRELLHSLCAQDVS